MHAGNMKFSTLNNERVSIYVITRIMSLACFLYICNKKYAYIIGVTENAIHDIDRCVAIFSTFYEMN